MFKNMYKGIKKKYKVGEIRKKSSKLKEQTYLQRADTVLCHMLCLAGNLIEDLEEDTDSVFSDILALLSSVKVQLMKCTQLTCADVSTNAASISDSELDQQSSMSAAENNDGVMSPSEISSPGDHPNTPVACTLIQHKKEKRMELRLILLANMPKHAYNNAVNLLKHICTDLRSNQQQLQFQ